MKKILAKVLCSIIVLGLFSTHLAYAEEKKELTNNSSKMSNVSNQNNPQAFAGKEFYCKKCGRSYDSIIGEYAKLYDNVYYINEAQKEMNDKATSYRRNPYYCYTHHNNFETGEICNAPGGFSQETKYKVHSYYEENETPVINVTQTLLYTGASLTPSFTVTFNGSTIDRSNYTYYIASSKDTSVRDYAYGQSGTKSVKDAGTYYLYVLFDPENTAGPNGTTFLGRLETTFTITNDVYELQDYRFSVNVNQLSFEYNGSVQQPKINSLSIWMPGKRSTESDRWMNLSSDQYSISYSGDCTNAGTHTMTITVPATYYETNSGSGWFKGTYSLDFTITSNGSSGGNNNSNNDDNGNTGNNGSSNGGNGSSSSSGSGSGSSTGSSNGSNSSSNGSTAGKKYSSEWVNGKWYNADGSQTYPYTMTWKCNSTGWWIEDSNGWYPANTWQKINGKWYYFTGSGYMDYSEYRDGCWLNADGSWNESYSGGRWSSNATGWWYTDNSGWYPVNSWLWIDGKNYHFNGSGYCTNPY